MKVNLQNYKDEHETREYIAVCESEFESQLTYAAERVLSMPGLRTVTLSGPSCSGKTTTAKKLIGSIEAAGRRAHVVSIDDFYKDRADTVMKRTATGELKPDYETIASIDLDTFSDFADRLGRGGEMRVPVFDFNTGCRASVREFTVEEGDIVILEGIQAIYPEITSRICEGENISVHISVGEPINVGGNVFEPHEVRLLRRLVRDYNYRSASPELTFYLWDEVRQNEIENIEPYTGGCDILINSLLSYEIGVIKPYLLRVLSEYAPGGQYSDIAARIAESVRGIIPIPLEYVPKESVFREFLH